MRTKIEIIKSGILSGILAVLAVFCILSWPAVFRNAARGEKEYAALLEKARSLSAKGIYADAVECLKKAETIQAGKEETLLLLADCLYRTGDEECLSVCDRLSRLSPQREEPYVRKAEWYRSRQAYGTAYAVLEEARENGCSSAILAGIGRELDNLFLRQYVFAESIRDWHPCGKQSFAVFSSGGKSGLLCGDGSTAVTAAHSGLGMLDSVTGTLPCMQEGTLCFVLPDGSRKLVPDFPADALGPFGSGLAPFEKDGSWGYLDTEMRIRLSGLEYAGPFCEGVAAVKKNGKWALMDASLNNLTPFSYENILADSYGFCCAYGRCVLQKNGLWYLADTRGNLLSEGYGHICFPASAMEDIAFCAGERWGFMNRDGAVTVLPSYDGANSYSLGLAPVKQGERWRYVRRDGTPAGTETYESAGVFSPEGRAAVENGGALYLIIQSRYFER